MYVYTCVGDAAQARHPHFFQELGAEPSITGPDPSNIFPNKALP